MRLPGKIVFAARLRAWPAIAAASALVLAGAGLSGAQAQTVIPPNCSGTVTPANATTNLGFIGGAAGAISATVSGVIGSVDTAFLSQQGNAFVSAPGNPVEGQPGAGVWVRSLAGEVTTKSVTSNAGLASGLGLDISLDSRCQNSIHQSYSGVQVGTDLSRLNINGWNIHVGATAGYLGSNATDNSAVNGGLRTGVEVPFVGGYVAATHGRFFADLMLRQEFYNLNLDSPAVGLINQSVGGHGLSVSASAGYNMALENNYFLEPSVGLIWSRTKVDPFTFTAPDGEPNPSQPTAYTFGGILSTSDVTSKIGRFSLRAGTTITTADVVYQPFVSASVFHEFAGDVAASFGLCTTCAKVVGTSVAMPLPMLSNIYSLQSSTSRAGTYGQFSLGVAAQLAGTGWLGFARADYRTGANIQGYAGNLGLRYQFAPDAAPSVRYAKARLRPAGATTDWTGFYLGAFAGGAYGRSDIGFANAPAPSSTSPYTSGPLGGLEAGYNFQVNNWVLGVEGDVALARLLGGRTCGDVHGTTNIFDPLYQKCSDRIDWTSSFAGRFGYSFGRTLLYAKGGVAWADGDVSVNCTDGGNSGSYCFNVNGDHYPSSMGSSTFANGTGQGTSARLSRLGWIAGLGTEFDLGGNWSAKAEYDYVQFGAQTRMASDGETRLSSRSSLNQVKIGLNYRLGAERAGSDFGPLYTKTRRDAVIRDWSGFYAGTNLGWADAASNWQNYSSDGATTANGQAGYTSEGTHAVSGPVAGGQFGYRVQSGRFVFGVEAQGDWAQLGGDNVSLLAFAGSNSTTNQTRIDGLGVFTGQIGYTAFNTLFYVKGGGLVASERYDVFRNDGLFVGATSTLAGAATDTRWGGAVGGGAEYAFARNWTAGIDYVHGFLGTRASTIPSVDNTGSYETERIRQGLDMVTLRLNYRFASDTMLTGR